ncbi:MAG: PKD domain-containing protein, partial [Saprospiraceae bacterium]|nr:PKD domain-containing protein [Saprospiraceae bacterium]
MIRFFTTLAMLLTATFIFAQKPVFQGQPYQNSSANKGIAATLTNWEVYQIDAESLNQFVKGAGSKSAFKFELGEHDWDIELHERDIRSSDFVLSVSGTNGTDHIKSKNDGIMTYRGHLPNDNGWAVALTLSQDFIYGYFKESEDTYFIEPLWYFVPGQPKNLYIVYAQSAVKPDNSHICGSGEMQNKMKELAPEEHDHKKGGDAEKMMACYAVDLAQAADLSMYNFHGSVAGVQAHMVGVMNNVQTNYDNEFADEIQFIIVEQFIVSPPATDPWTSSTNYNALLNDFTDWGPTGFFTDHDLGQLWTKRSPSGGVVGIAWLDAVCTSIRYHVLWEWTSDANNMRVTASHEIGHNFGCVHDSGTGFIMSPVVNNTNAWSTQSINTFNANTPTYSCLASCGSSQPPVANFTANPISGCTPLTVQYTDLSTNSPNTWSWTFPGGTPSTSTDQNPIVVYNNGGVFGATLTVTNNVASSTLTQSNLINVQSSPTASFFTTDVGPLTVSFTNTSSFGTSYLWDFGDGNTSTASNPTHAYAIDGFYDVSLTVTNNCGTDIINNTISVFTAPFADFSASPTSGCPTLAVNFQDQSSPNTLTWTWSFPGGTPSTSSLQNPTVIYTNPGTYSVTLTASNPAGNDQEVRTAYITVGSTPTANFTFVVNGSSVTFTNTSVNPPGSGTLVYAWDFGDGNSSTDASPTHVYSAGGTYTVSLTTTNLCGSNIKTQQVTIQLPPVAGFTATPTSGCTPLSVQFTSTSQGASTYSWTFPGGTPSSSTAQNPTVVYNSVGSYDVSLTVTNASGSNSASQTNYITTNTTATAGFTSSVNGNTASFTNSSTNATSYSWNFGDGSPASTETNPTHAYGNNGTYTVVLSATNACGTVTSSQTVSIVTAPSAAFTGTPTSGCGPLTVQFTNQSSSNATSWSWSFPGGTPSSSTEQNPTVVYNTAGTYTVSLTATNSAGSNTATQTNYITVNTTATAAFTSSVNGNTASFTNGSSNATSYSWNFGDGSPASTEANPTHTYANNGTYTVVLSATNACGTVTSSQTVSIVTAPAAAFTGTPTSGCGPLTVQFTNQSSSNATSWSWSFPGGTPSSSTEQNPTVVYNTAGTYTVSLTATNSAGSNTATQTNYITVQAGPSAAYTFTTAGNTTSFTNGSSNATSYSWNFGDGSPANTETSPAHTYAGEGTYTVVLTATGPCGTNTSSQQVIISSLPVAAFAATPTSGCSPLTVQFQDQSS